MNELPIGTYWKRRPLEGQPEFEENYWGTVRDPDGVIRVRSEERERVLEDVSAELSFFNSLPGGRLLDVGCGRGFFLSALGPQWERHGVEVSSVGAESARAFAKVHLGELKDAAYPDAYFDAVMCHHVIEHVPDPQAFFTEIRRVLRPGGDLVLATPDFDSGCARRFGERYRLLHDRTHTSLFTLDSLRRFVRDHGFAIERVDFPFFQTRWFTEENLKRLFDTSLISPPFYGNFMSFYCRRLPDAAVRVAEIAAAVSLVGEADHHGIAAAAELIEGARRNDRQIWVIDSGAEGDRLAESFAAVAGGSVSSAEKVSSGWDEEDVVIMLGTQNKSVAQAAKRAGVSVILISTRLGENTGDADVVIQATAGNDRTRYGLLLALACAFRDPA